MLPHILCILCLATLTFATSQRRSLAPGRVPHLLPRSNASLDKIASSWYTGWHADDFPLSRVSWDKYNVLIYAFAITTPSPDIISLQDSDKQLLRELVQTAHQNNAKASLSIGGWTGSRYFSSNVGSANNRTAFITSVTNLVKEYDLDGIDFDWEYPGRQGIGCNLVSPNDTSNFLAFLTQLRSHPLGSDLLLTAATALTPFADATGHPSASVSGFAKVLDYIEIMNYDVWNPVYGRMSQVPIVGPNAPLDDACAGMGQRNGSATSAVEAWTSAGMPRSQIVLGVPAYGHSFRVAPKDAFGSAGGGADGDKLNLFAAFDPDPSKEPRGDAWDGEPGTDVCGVWQAQGGLFNFWGMVQEGWLNADGTVREGKGVVGKFDECSQTPLAYNSSSQVMISYDDARSFTAKGEFIRSNNLRGFAMWETGGDLDDVLLSAILSATTSDNPISKSSSGSTGQTSASAARSTRLHDVSYYSVLIPVLALFGLPW